jgi:N-acetylglutamate synthase-like GNAT family acetyltransferase
MKKLRILQPDEFDRLKEFEPYNRGLALPIPGASRVAVAEIEGRIVGFWVASAVVHIEPLFIAPEERNGGFTATALLKTLVDELKENEIENVYCFSETETNSNYLSRLGFSKLPPTELFLGKI